MSESENNTPETVEEEEIIERPADYDVVEDIEISKEMRESDRKSVV